MTSNNTMDMDTSNLCSDITAGTIKLVHIDQSNIPLSKR